MTLENKSAKYICIMGGIILIMLFLSGFMEYAGATYMSGTVAKVHEIEEYLVLNKDRHNGVYLDDYDYRAIIDVDVSGANYQALVERDTKSTFPQKGDSIKIAIYPDGSVGEAQIVRTSSGGIILLIFGVILLLGGLTGKVKEK